jgi:hypothetical protein
MPPDKSPGQSKNSRPESLESDEQSSLEQAASDRQDESKPVSGGGGGGGRGFLGFGRFGLSPRREMPHRG